MALGLLHLSELFAGEGEVEVRVGELGVQGGGILVQDQRRLVLVPIVQHVPEVEAGLGVRRLEFDGLLEARPVQVNGSDVLRYANLRLEEKAKPATINRELAALRAACRLGLDNDLIAPMPRIRLLPENKARQGFADAKHLRTICRKLQNSRPDVADAGQFMFITGWRSRSEVLPLDVGPGRLRGQPRAA